MNVDDYPNIRHETIDGATWLCLSDFLRAVGVTDSKHLKIPASCKKHWMYPDANGIRRHAILIREAHLKHLFADREETNLILPDVTAVKPEADGPAMIGFVESARPATDDTHPLSRILTDLNVSCMVADTSDGVRFLANDIARGLGYRNVQNVVERRCPERRVYTYRDGRGRKRSAKFLTVRDVASIAASTRKDTGRELERRMRAEGLLDGMEHERRTKIAVKGAYREALTFLDLRPERVTDRLTGRNVDTAEFDGICMAFLHQCLDVRQRIVRDALEAGMREPRGDGETTTVWARENMPDAPLPDDWVDKSQALYALKTAAARECLSYWMFHRIDLLLREHGRDLSYARMMELLGWRPCGEVLYRNIVRREADTPEPKPTHGMFPYCETALTHCRKPVYANGMLLVERVAVGTRYYDLRFRIGALERRFPNLRKISRPELAEHGDGRPVWRFIIQELVHTPRISELEHGVGVDLNAPHTGGLGIARVYADGAYRRLVPPKRVRVMEARYKRLMTERNRCHPDGEQWRALTGRLKTYGEALDVEYARALIGMLMPGEGLFVEDLRFLPSHTVRSHFRRTLSSMCARHGVRLLSVNPKATSRLCVACHGRCRRLSDRRLQCMSCGLVLDRDLSAAVLIGRRGLDRVRNSGTHQEE